MKKLLPIIYLVISFTAKSQTGDLPFQAGAANGAMGGAQSASPGVWATHHNPGLLPWQENAVVAIGVENRFLMSALNGQGLAAVIPTSKAGVFGVGLTSHGYDLYRRSRIGLSYGLQLGEGLSGGITIHYDMLSIGNNYGSSGALSATAGFSAKVTDDLMLGAYVFNPLRAQFSENVDEIIPTILAFGASYHFSEKVFVNGEVEKDINFKPGLKMGIQYKPKDVIYLRAGFRTLPQSYTFGFGLELNKFRMDMAAWMHPVLGFSPNVSLQYDFK